MTPTTAVVARCAAQRDELLGALEKRFEKNMNRHKGVTWAKVKAKLDANPESWKPLVSAARRGRVTLVYSSRDTEHNNAVALRQYLLRKLGSGSTQLRVARSMA